MFDRALNALKYIDCLLSGKKIYIYFELRKIN